MCLTSDWVFFEDFFHARRRLFRLFDFFDFLKNETKRFFGGRIGPLSVSLCLDADSVVDIRVQIFNLDFCLRRRQISQRFVAAKQLNAEFQVRKRRVFDRPRNRRAAVFDICGHERRSADVWRRTARRRHFENGTERPVAGTVRRRNAETVNWTFKQLRDFVVALFAAVNHLPRAKKSFQKLFLGNKGGYLGSMLYS